MSQRHKPCELLLAGLALCAVSLAGNAAAETPLEGAWRITKSESADGKLNESPQPALFIFTSSHYSIVIATGNEPRAESEGEQISAAEKLLAYDSFIANAGRYEMAGNTFRTRAYVAKSPDYMGGWPDHEQTYEFTLDGDTLIVSGVGPAAIEVTLARAEGDPVPW